MQLSCFLVVFGPDAVTTYDHQTCLNSSLTVTKIIQQLTNQSSRMYVGIYPGYSAFLSPEDARRGAGRCARAGQNSPETSDHRSRGDGFRHLETVGLSVELRPIASPAVTEHPTHGGGCGIVEVACWNGTRPQRAKIRMALLNARSLANKTFLLRDFFSIPDLDFLRLTATRRHAGESAPFSELLPPSCSFCRSLQTSVLD